MPRQTQRLSGSIWWRLEENRCEFPNVMEERAQIPSPFWSSVSPPLKYKGRIPVELEETDYLLTQNRLPKSNVGGAGTAEMKVLAPVRVAQGGISPTETGALPLRSVCIYFFLIRPSPWASSTRWTGVVRAGRLAPFPSWQVQHSPPLSTPLAVDFTSPPLRAVGVLVSIHRGFFLWFEV